MNGLLSVLLLCVPVLLLCAPVLLLCAPALLAQRQVVGTVIDGETGEPLQFANVWVQESHKGTTSDRDGRFTLALEAGEHRVTASYIGYGSQTKTVSVPAQGEMRFVLRSSAFEMPQVEVTPGDNPALRIIRRAIEMKEVRRERLRNYSLTSHSKVLLRMSGALKGMMETRGERSRVGVGIGGGTEDASTSGDTTAQADSARVLPIILETQTEAWWAAPDRYKEIITARKQSAMIPSQGNIIISQFFIVDFSDDDFRFDDRSPVPGPISERGLRSYYYRLIGTTRLEDTKIYQIEISALDENDPLFEGMIYIADSTYALSMVDVHLNDAALPTMFTSLAFKQHFRLFDGEFWQPVDVVFDADVNVPVVNIGIGIEGFSVLQDWRINQQINENFFDRTRIKVLKEADERDSAYWEANAKIPSTDEEQRAYERADSVKAAMDSTKYDVGLMDLLVGGTTGSDHVNVSFPGLLGLYHFNRVEGHALEGSASFRMPDIPLRTLSAMAGYGFNDKRMKWSVAGGVQIFDTPRLQLTAERYATLGFFDQGNRLLGTAGTTLTTLLLKYDLYDYFYQDGWSAGTSYDLLMLFPVSMSVSRNHYLNAVNTTNESIFRRDWIFRENPAINEGSILSVYGEVTVDARDFIDNAGVIRRFGTRNHVPTVGIGWHQADIEGTQWEYLSWTARLNGSFEFGIAGAFAYRLVATGTGGPLATQSLYSLPGSIEYFADSRRFRTLGFREFGGDRRVTAMFTYNLRDWLFRASGLPLLAGSGLGVELFASSGWATMTDATRSLQRVHVSEAKLPFWEVGFGIDNILTLFRIDFAWRLNHFRPGRNFFFGLNAGVLL